ncbi:MAG: GAF domain-containing protein [Spirochaetes bacterium]|nr:MAG: GAF domain-containing protein [Spirochaetota bacterium]
MENDRKTLSLAKISFINQKINSSMELSTLLNVILETGKEIVNAEGSSLLLADGATGDLVFLVVHGDKREVIKDQKVPRGKGIVGIVADTGKPLIVTDAQNDPRFFKEIDSKSEFHTKNLVCVPMMVMGKLVGVLEAVNAIGRQGFDETDQRLLTYIADQAAIALNYRSLVDELTSRIDELTALYEISQTLSVLKFDHNVLNNIMSSISKALSSERSSLMLYDQERKKLVLIASYGLPETITPGTQIDIDDSVAGYVYKTGDPLIVVDRAKDFPFLPVDPTRTYRTKSFIAAPVRHNNQTIGVLSITDRKDSSIFDSINLRVITTIANHVADAYRNIEYLNNIEAQRRLEQEIDIAAEIQRKILPAIPKSFRTHRMAAFNKPAKEVGGDFYDFSRIDENKYAVLIGDVSGKGIPAALFMGSARNIVRAEMRINNQPATLLAHSNKYVREDSEHGMFVTLFYMLVDTHNSIINYGCAGHNPPLLIRNKTREIVKLNARGKALGIAAESAFEERIILFEPGDMLILFTDGVLEYLGDRDIDEGEERLIEIALGNFEKSPVELIGLLEEKLSEKSLHSDFMDDFTILFFKF